MTRSLTDCWRLGGITIPNRVVLAPLAGIGNWFVRLQAKRHGAGLVVSEMVSSFAVHYRNERTCRELLRIHPDEHPVSMQLFGHDPDVMASAAERVAAAGADLIDINMGCPVPKVCKTGAGAALLEDPARAVALARARHAAADCRSRSSSARGSGPETSGRRGGSPAVSTAAWPASASIPRHASQRTQGHAGLRARARAGRGAAGAGADLAAACTRADRRAGAFEQTGAAAVLLARGSLGNPWLFEQVLGRRRAEPTREEILDEVDWVIDRPCEHLGRDRATRYLRKFYPWYVERLGGDKPLQAALQPTPTLAAARELLARPNRRASRWRSSSLPRRVPAHWQGGRACGRGCVRARPRGGRPGAAVRHERLRRLPEHPPAGPERLGQRDAGGRVQGGRHVPAACQRPARDVLRTDDRGPDHRGADPPVLQGRDVRGDSRATWPARRAPSPA